MAKTFSAQIDASILKTRARMRAVVQDATQTTINIAQKPVAKGGNMPIDTGNLRASLNSSIQGGASQGGAEAYSLVIAGMEAGDVADFTWGNDNVNYAVFVEYGTRGRPGRHFMGTAAAAWPNTVAASVAKAKARFK